MTPVTPAIASSTRFVTCVSSSDGAAPACVTLICTIGTSRLGKRVTGSERKLNTPSVSSTMKSTSEGTGRRMAQAETLSRAINYLASLSCDWS